MADIVVLETYPYEARFGGDPAYIHSLVNYLYDKGHRIHLLVSDIYRGRTLPCYRSAYSFDSFVSTSVKNAIRLGQYVVGVHPLKIAAAPARRLRSNRRPEQDSYLSPSEIDWARRQLSRLCPDAVILCFDAVRLAPFLANDQWRLIALPSIIRGLDVSLGEHLATDAAYLEIPADFLAGLAASDLITTNTESDARVVRQRLPFRRTIVVGMGLPFKGQTVAPHSADVLLVGSRSAPNIESVNWLLDHVWSHVIAACPSARLRLVGHIAGAAGVQNTSVDHVGPVDDVTAEYARAAVVVAPLIKGSTGLKTKVIEAISHAVPLVTTSIGVDAARRDMLGQAGLIADNPAEFADAVISILRNTAKQSAMRLAAKQLHEHRFSAEACYSELEAEIAASSRRDAIARPPVHIAAPG